MALKKLLQLFCVGKKDSNKKGAAAHPGFQNSEQLFSFVFLNFQFSLSALFHLSALVPQIWARFFYSSLRHDTAI
jgi:hypothetical protein